MSGHYIFPTDILKNTWTIIVIIIIIIIVSLICRYTHTVYILYINVICVPTRNRNNEFILEFILLEKRRPISNANN